MSKPQITIDEFSKIEVRIGTVKSAERVPETEKLLKLIVDFGPKEIVPEVKVEQEGGVPAEKQEAEVERDVRQIVSGIAAYVTDPAELVGRQLAFVTNLAPRMLRGLESNGMLFAVGNDETFAFVTPDREVPPGTSAH